MVWQLQRVMSSWALALLLLAVGSQYSDASKPKKPTNIIFMMADDLGWGDVEYNNGTARTPHLNEMSTAAGSLRLNRYYSGGPVCSPTRGTVLTGRNHNRYCVWTANAGNNKPDFAVAERMPLPSYEYTIATAAKAAGYSTAMFGKWHLGDFFQLPKSNPKWPSALHPQQQPTADASNRINARMVIGRTMLLVTTTGVRIHLPCTSMMLAFTVLVELLYPLQT
eukprot:scpid15963/ scgid1026/ Arylsulfatase B; N-acetylgalactosamine-4-sulfatase